LNKNADSLNLDLSLEQNASEEEVLFVQQGLRSFNNHFIVDDGFQSVTIFLRKEDGSIAGGLLGEIYWGWLHISILWIDENFRGLGYGEQLLRMAEEEAIQKSCHSVHLDTESFQAQRFYEKHGYTVFGLLDDHPIGHQRIFLVKKLLHEYTD